VQSKAARQRLLSRASAWLGVSLLSLASAGLSPARAADTSRAAAMADPIAGPLPSQSAASSIRALLRSGRLEARAELVELSFSPEVTGDARTLLLAVRALHASSYGRFYAYGGDPTIERALLRHLRTPPDGDNPPLRALARASAAHSLALHRNAESLRALVLLARGPDTLDPELSRLARSALLAYPPDQALIDAAFPWQSESERAETLAWIETAEHARDKRRSEHCRLAKRQLPGLGELPAAAAAAFLSDLALCPLEQRPVSADFARLAASSPSWALRGMAAVGVGQADASWQERARSELRAKDPTLRSAAAWFLATTSREAAERLALDPRPEVRAAAKKQLMALELAEPELRPRACPQAWARLTTSELFRRFTSGSEQSELVLGCLASRLRREPGPGLRALDLEAQWAATPTVARVLAASALGDVPEAAWPQAKGLTKRLFAVEADATVRRFLCLSQVELSLHQGWGHSPTLMIDPDPVCRAIGGGSMIVTYGSPALSTVTTQKQYFAARELSPPLALEPAPDGFVGARVPAAPAGSASVLDFVDCRETGEPAWACGKAAQTPR